MLLVPECHLYITFLLPHSIFVKFIYYSTWYEALYCTTEFCNLFV